MLVRDIILGFSENWIVGDGTEQIKIEAITAPLLDNNRTLYHEASVKEVNFTDIPLLKLRSHFEPGMLGNSPALHRNSRYKKINLDPSLCGIQPLEQVDGAEQWFKRTDNLAFQKLRHMNVLVFHDPIDDLVFLTPCTVLANYYLAHSKLLQAAMKMTTIDRLRLGIKRFPDGQVHIHLPPDVPTKLAPHIARFELDPIAKSAFAAIHPNSLHKPNRAIQSFHMSAPVRGNLTWHIQYVEPENSKVAWVTQIISCSSAFPFSTLLIFQNIKRYRGDGKKKRKARKMGRIEDIDHVELGQQSDCFFETVEIRDANIKNEYPGLSDVQVHKLKRVIKKDKEKKYISTIEDIHEALALSTGVHGLGNNKLPLIPTETSNLDELNEDNGTPENPDTRLDDFLNMIEALQEKNYVVKNVQFEQTRPLVAPLDENVLPFIKSYELREIPWHRKSGALSLKNNFHDWHMNTRRYLIKLVKIKLNYVYLVEFIYQDVTDVGCTLLIVTKDELPDEIVMDKIVKYVKNKSGWTALSKSTSNQLPHEKNSRDYRLHKLAHKEYMKNPEKFCNRIIALSTEFIAEE